MGRNRRTDRLTSTPRRDPLYDLVRDPVLPIPRPLPDLRGLEVARALVRSLEDRRTFHPLRDLRPLGSVRKEARRIRVAPAKTRGLYPSAGLRFSDPKLVAKCVRRKERREVLFASKRTGKGARARRRRDAFSGIGC